MAAALRAPIVVLTGAGLSTASGIPDYRSKDGMWARFDPDEFHITRFHADPARFWDRRVELTTAMRILDAQPNDGHRVLAEAAQGGRVETIVTQNIDGLHGRAGTPSARLVEVHGNAALCVCLHCGGKEPTREVIARHVPGVAPRCTTCMEGLLKPDVVLFGEPVPLVDVAARAVARAGTFVAAGTSLQVWPVAGLVQLALERGAELIIANRDPTPFDAKAADVLRGPVVEALVTLFDGRAS